MYKNHNNSSHVFSQTLTKEGRRKTRMLINDLVSLLETCRANISEEMVGWTESLEDKIDKPIPDSVISDCGDAHFCLLVATHQYFQKEDLLKLIKPAKEMLRILKQVQEPLQSFVTTKFEMFDKTVSDLMKIPHVMHKIEHDKRLSWQVKITLIHLIVDKMKSMGKCRKRRNKHSARSEYKGLMEKLIELRPHYYGYPCVPSLNMMVFMVEDPLETLEEQLSECNEDTEISNALLMEG